MHRDTKHGDPCHAITPTIRFLSSLLERSMKRSLTRREAHALAGFSIVLGMLALMGCGLIVGLGDHSLASSAPDADADASAADAAVESGEAHDGSCDVGAPDPT